jgi:hypothetical protein
MNEQPDFALNPEKLYPTDGCSLLPQTTTAIQASYRPSCARPNLAEIKQKVLQILTGLRMKYTNV